MEKKRIGRFRISRNLAIAIILLLLSLITAGLAGYTGVFIHGELRQFWADLPEILEVLRGKMDDLMKTANIGGYLTGKTGGQITGFLQKNLPAFTEQVTGSLSVLTMLGTLLVLAPFILFYFLRDDSKLAAKLICRIPEPYRKHVYRTLSKADHTLAAYISGRVSLALALGILFYLGYLVAGVRYPLILAVIAAIASFIPVFGTLITVVPALIVGSVQTIWVIVKLLGAVLLINILKSRLLASYFIGRKLKIHSLTLIVLFLAAGALSGFIGLLVVVPVYAVTKVLIKGGIRLYRIRRLSKTG